MAGRNKTKWPKAPTCWIDNKILYISIPFTWNLPDVKSMLMQRSLFWNHAVVGGPAIDLMPDFIDLEWVSIDRSCHKARHPRSDPLKRINPMATRTTIGCIRKCKFCAVPRIEGPLVELEDWDDKPILIDNNLLAASQQHFDRVIDRLVKWKWADFNQGLDSRLLTTYHAERLKQIKKPMIRLALDDISYQDQWSTAFEKLRAAGIAKTNIRSYALLGFKTGPDEGWKRCEWIESHGIRVLPAWFHELDALRQNDVTERQKELGWTDTERKRIMQWYYQHKEIHGRSKYRKC